MPEKKRPASRWKNDETDRLETTTSAGGRQRDEHATRTHMVHRRRRGKEGKTGKEEGGLRRRFACSDLKVEPWRSGGEPVRPPERRLVADRDGERLGFGEAEMDSELRRGVG